MGMHRNSRTTKLAAMAVGESLWLSAPTLKPLAAFMNNLGVDMRRVEEHYPDVKFTQKKWIAVNPDTAETVILVCVTKMERNGE
jgi:hypothetical protein